MYTDNALLFPRQIISTLRHLRGEKWETLCERVAALPERHEETLAFMLMMVNLNGCLSCETDSYRAMKGCCACAQQTLRRFKGSDDELLKLYQDALNEVRAYARQGTSLSHLVMGGSATVESQPDTVISLDSVKVRRAPSSGASHVHSAVGD